MNARTDAALRSLDAASPTLTSAELERASAALDRIVATSPGPEHRAAPTPPRRPSRRRVLIPAAAATVALGWLLVPGMGGGGTAYASWSATPAAVSTRDLEAVKEACQDRLRSYVDDDSSPVHLDAGGATLALAERRGDYVALLYRWDNPDMSIPCLARNSVGSTDVDDIGMAAGGSSGPALKAPAMGYTQGAIAQFAGSQTASVTDGAVGDGVVGVTIHAGSLTVEATVHNGRYAAWWPGPAFVKGPAQPSGEGGPQPILTYDLTLDDGTTIPNAQPARPS